MSTPDQTIAALRQHNRILREQGEAMRRELARYEDEVLRLSRALERRAPPPEVASPPSPPCPVAPPPPTPGLLARLGLRR